MEALSRMLFGIVVTSSYQAFLLGSENKDELLLFHLLFANYTLQRLTSPVYREGDVFICTYTLFLTITCFKVVMAMKLLELYS